MSCRRERRSGRGGAVRDLLEWGDSMVRKLVSAALLCLVLAPSAQALETLYVQSATQLRQSPSEAAPALLALEPGSVVESFGRRGDWVNVRTAGSPQAPAAAGWLHHSVVGPSPPRSEPQPASRESPESRERR
jgi:hypothetical protein